MSSPFTVVICHGSYHTPAPYQPFVEALKARGIEAYCPQLPSSDLAKLNVGDILNPDFAGDPPRGGYPQSADDVQVINMLLERLIVREGKRIILVGHSAGGFSATAAAIPALQAKKREIGGIIGIFYICAFLVPPGDSIHTFFQPKDGSDPVVPPYCNFANGFGGLASTKEGAKYFFNGLDDAQAKYWESTLTASPVLTTVLGNDAYAALPCVYLVTEDDMALPAAYQDGMIAMQNQRLESKIAVLRCSSGHSPHLTRTEELADEVQGFGRSIAAEFM